MDSKTSVIFGTASWVGMSTGWKVFLKDPSLNKGQHSPVLAIAELVLGLMSHSWGTKWFARTSLGSPECLFHWPLSCPASAFASATAFAAALWLSYTGSPILLHVIESGEHFMSNIQKPLLLQLDTFPHHWCTPMHPRAIVMTNHKTTAISTDTCPTWEVEKPAIHSTWDWLEFNHIHGLANVHSTGHAC